MNSGSPERTTSCSLGRKLQQGLKPIRKPPGTGSLCGVFGGKFACPPLFRKSSDRCLSPKSFFLLLLAATTLCPAADTIVIKSGTDSLGQRKMTGTIVDFDAQWLNFRSGSGRANRIPATSVISFETTWPAAKNEADQLFAARKFDQALAKYRSAASEESRAWAKRLIQAEIVWCLRSLGQPSEACNEFFRLLAMDPTKQHLAAMPLAWSTSRLSPILQRRAHTWLENEEPIVRLMGASWLLSVDRGQAVTTLERLTSDTDSRIAQLAAAQLWRTKLATASDGDLVKWHDLLNGMPEVLRGGPYFALGRVLAYRKQHEQAALAFMRVPTLYPKDSQLVIDSLLAAANELQKLGRTNEAAGLYRELVNDYQDSPQAAQASAQLKAIVDNNTD